MWDFRTKGRRCARVFRRRTGQIPQNLQDHQHRVKSSARICTLENIPVLLHRHSPSSIRRSICILDSSRVTLTQNIFLWNMGSTGT